MTGKGRHFDARALVCGTELHQWCDFRELTEKGTGCTVRLETSRKVLVFALAVMTVDTKKPPGRQVKCYMIATTGLFSKFNKLDVPAKDRTFKQRVEQHLIEFFQ